MNPRVNPAVMPEQIPVPLRDQSGVTIAYAVLDAVDAHLAERCWYLDSDSRPNGKMYARRNEGVRPVYLHREVLAIEPPSGYVIDHINGLTLDNRRANLRIATIAENAQNQPRRRTNASSRYRGVTWDKARGKWQARATLNYKFKLIGRFDSEDDAGAAAAAWRAEHMPFSAEASPCRSRRERGGEQR